jgi:1-phosphatidylinositol-3-phosphate 5-kinase
MPSSRPPAETPSPAASLAAGAHVESRRASIGSDPPQARLDKESFLDHIHTSASRSDVLTTFDDFAPPRPGSKGEAKAFAGDIVQGGLSGLYSRLKASVGAAKDAVAGSTGNDSADDASIRSAKATSGPTKSVGMTAITSPTTASASSSRLQSPMLAKFPESLSITTTNSTLPKLAASSSSSTGQTRSGLQALETLNLSSRTDGVYVESRSPEETRQNLGLAQSTGSTSSPTTHPIRHPRHGESFLEGNGRNQDPGGVSLSKVNSRATLQSLSNAQAEPFRVDRQDSDAASVYTDQSGQANDPERTPRNPAKRNERPKPVEGYSSSTLKAYPRPITTQNIPLLKEPPGNSDFNSESQTESYIAYQRPPLIQVSQSHLPGFRANSSSDGDLSSLATSIAPTRRANFQNLEEHRSMTTERNSHGLHDTTSRMRNKILAKELWMQDKNAKDCFYCGDAFSAWRRKHHCRKCLDLSLFTSKSSC